MWRRWDRQHLGEEVGKPTSGGGRRWDNQYLGEEVGKPASGGGAGTTSIWGKEVGQRSFGGGGGTTTICGEGERLYGRYTALNAIHAAAMFNYSRYANIKNNYVFP